MGKIEICLDLMQEEQDDNVGYLDPYDDDPWSMNNVDRFGYAEPRSWNATKIELVFNFNGLKWYVHFDRLGKNSMAI